MQFLCCRVLYWLLKQLAIWKGSLGLSDRLCKLMKKCSHVHRKENTEMHSGLLCIWVTDDLIIIKTRGHWWFTEGLLFLASYSYDSTSVWPQPLKLCGEVNRLSRVRNVLDVTTYKCSLFTELHAVHVVPQVNHWDRLMGHFIPQSSTQGALITGAPLTAACTYCKKKKKNQSSFLLAHHSWGGVGMEG